MKASKHVIIGNSAAGLSAVKAIRKRGCADPITLVAAENCHAYSPVLLTYYIANKISRDGLFVTNDRFYQDYDVRLKLGKRAVSIDTAKQLVYLEDDTTVEYDDLLIATGAKAKSLGCVEPDANEYVSSLRTIGDAEKIIELSRNAREAVVIGAGLVSLQVVNAVFKLGLKLTLVVSSGQILSQSVNPECANIIQNRLESHGVQILFNREVITVKRAGNKAHVITSMDEELPADLVIVGKGIKPNIGLIKNGGITVNNGILVDDYMKTNLENIFAAGDVAEGRNSISGKMEVIANWPSACTQGETAGLNMIGHPVKHGKQLRENVTTILGATIASIGLINPKSNNITELEYIDHRRGRYRNFLLDSDKIIGTVLLDELGDIGVIRNCVTGEINVSQWKKRGARARLELSSMLLKNKV